jgi:phage/plasmid-like protein (TIGR03299 family)
LGADVLQQPLFYLKKKGTKIMPANVETMFYVRVAPWHNLGVCVEEALSSGEALEKSGLDWKVLQRPIMTATYDPIPGYKANIRDTDNRVLGVVTDRYKIVQNHEAFAFVDALLGEGVRFETAGSLYEGRKVWMLAKLPDRYTLNGEEIEPYLVFTNSHDGNSSIRVAMTPIRVVCQNTLNLALSGAKRIWSTMHVGDLSAKMNEAHNTLRLAENYMGKLGEEFSRLSQIQVPDARVQEYIEMLLPMDDDPTEIHKRNIERVREDFRIRYFEAPDLTHVGKNAYRFICAVSDFATHAEPLRNTINYRENVFAKTINGNPLIDKAYEIILAA